MWCDNNNHIWKDCANFAEALKNNVVYLWNSWVHASETRRPVEMNTGCGGMKRLMEEVKARHVEAIHYLASAKIRVGGETSVSKERGTGFWSLVLESF